MPRLGRSKLKKRNDIGRYGQTPPQFDLFPLATLEIVLGEKALDCTGSPLCGCQRLSWIYRDVVYKKYAERVRIIRPVVYFVLAVIDVEKDCDYMSTCRLDRVGD